MHADAIDEAKTSTRDRNAGTRFCSLLFYSGGPIATDYARAAAEQSAPEPAPYPVQHGLTTPMRIEAQRAGDVQRMQVWAGQSAALVRAKPAGQLVKAIWNDAQALLH